MSEGLLRVHCVQLLHHPAPPAPDLPAGRVPQAALPRPRLLPPRLLGRLLGGLLGGLLGRLASLDHQPHLGLVLAPGGPHPQHLDQSEVSIASLNQSELSITLLACCSGRSILRHFSTRQKVCDLGPPSSAGSAPIYWNSTSSTCSRGP